jgi:ankyrin repeat protein
VELLLERDHSAIFDKDEENNTALHLASTACMAKTVEALLKQVPLLD